MPTRTNLLHLRQESTLLSEQPLLYFSTPAPRSSLSRPQSYNAVREVPLPTAPSRYLTRREAAAYVRCSLRFLDGMELPFIRKGRYKVYDRIDLDARLLGTFVWQQAVVRYLEEFADKRSLSDGKEHLKELDPHLRSLKLDAIDTTVLQPFIRDGKLKDGVSKATVNRALEVVRRILNVAHQDWRWLSAVPRIRMLKEPRRRVRFLRHDERLTD